MHSVLIATWMDGATTGNCNCNCNCELLELELELKDREPCWQRQVRTQACKAAGSTVESRVLCTRTQNKLANSTKTN
jgi:hypothetical protein